MPYASIAALPASVRERYSERCQDVFRRTWNGAYTRAHDEGSAFAIAHTAARRCMSSVGKASWDTAYVNNLPDSAFACIDAGGHKEGGKTVPRSLRHYPHHDAAGAVDLPHLRNAMGRVMQAGTADCGKAHLRMHARIEKIGEFAA